MDEDQGLEFENGSWLLLHIVCSMFWRSVLVSCFLVWAVVALRPMPCWVVDPQMKVDLLEVVNR